MSVSNDVLPPRLANDDGRCATEDSTAGAPLFGSFASGADAVWRCVQPEPAATPYYYNETLGVSRWTRPETSVIRERSQQLQLLAPAPLVMHASDWQACSAALRPDAESRLGVEMPLPTPANLAYAEIPPLSMPLLSKSAKLGISSRKEPSPRPRREERRARGGVVADAAGDEPWRIPPLQPGDTPRSHARGEGVQLGLTARPAHATLNSGLSVPSSGEAEGLTDVASSPRSALKDSNKRGSLEPSRHLADATIGAAKAPTKRATIELPPPKESGRRMTMDHSSPRDSARRMTVDHSSPRDSFRRMTLDHSSPRDSVRRMTLDHSTPREMGRRVTMEQSTPRDSAARRNPDPRMQRSSLRWNHEAVERALSPANAEHPEEASVKKPPPHAVMPRPLWNRLEALRQDPDLFRSFQLQVEAQLEQLAAKRRMAWKHGAIARNIAGAREYSPEQRERQLQARLNERKKMIEEVQSRRTRLSACGSPDSSPGEESAPTLAKKEGRDSARSASPEAQSFIWGDEPSSFQKKKKKEKPRPPSPKTHKARARRIASLIARGIFDEHRGTSA